jgi:RNA polymerase sigma-70 factor (ECF subfamily)
VFERIFDENVAVVHRFCQLRNGVSAENDDLVSVVFLEAWRTRAAAFEVEGSLRPWLLGIARNVCRSRFRSLRRHRTALTRLAAFTDDQPDHASSVAESVDNERQARRLTAALDSLTTREREVVLLVLVEGLSLLAAAQLLHMPLGTVKSTLARGRTRMQRVLQSSDSTDPGPGNGHHPYERGAPAPGERTGSPWR